MFRFRCCVPLPTLCLILQAAVDACFALVGYERLLDYTAEPPGALSEADRAWARQRVTA